MRKHIVLQIFFLLIGIAMFVYHLYFLIIHVQWVTNIRDENGLNIYIHYWQLNVLRESTYLLLSCLLIFITLYFFIKYTCKGYIFPQRTQEQKIQDQQNKKQQKKQQKIEDLEKQLETLKKEDE